jgi:hypothetical protein
MMYPIIATVRKTLDNDLHEYRVEYHLKSYVHVDISTLLRPVRKIGRTDGDQARNDVDGDTEQVCTIRNISKLMIH